MCVGSALGDSAHLFWGKTLESLSPTVPLTREFLSAGLCPSFLGRKLFCRFALSCGFHHEQDLVLGGQMSSRMSATADVITAKRECKCFWICVFGIWLLLDSWAVCAGFIFSLCIKHSLGEGRHWASPRSTNKIASWVTSWATFWEEVAWSSLELLLWSHS